MLQNLRIGALLLIGGSGLRFGNAIPKQFCYLGPQRIYQYALETLENSRLFDEILIVCHPEWLHLLEQKGVSAGKTRQESSYLGLCAFQTAPQIVLIHDGVRPFVSQRILEENVSSAISFGAVNTCIPSTDTLVHSKNAQEIDSIPPRSQFFRGQTPQTFQTPLLLAAHEQAKRNGIENASDDCQLVLQMGHPVHIVSGEEQNFKITSSFDLALAETYTNQRKDREQTPVSPSGKY